MKIILACGGTGGHIYPAIAIANTVRAHEPDSQILFVGSTRGIENQIVAKAGYDITHIDMYGLNRKNPLANIKTAYYFLASGGKARKLIKDFAPDFVIGTGGYQCYPPLAAAAKAGIPCAVHESNSIPGKAVRMVEKHVNRVYTNFPGVAERLAHKEKVMRVGNPLVSENIVRADAGTRASLGIPKNAKFVLLSFGGSRGAAPINENMLDFIAEYAPTHPEMYFAHATGSAGYTASCEKAEKLGISSLPNVRIMEYIYDMPVWEAAADMVICRAGAITLSELQMCSKPSVLIPSPYVAENHQYHNAMTLQNRGAAIVIEEKDLTDGVLWEQVQRLLRDPNRLAQMGKAAKDGAYADANERIYSALMKLL